MFIKNRLLRSSQLRTFSSCAKRLLEQGTNNSENSVYQIKDQVDDYIYRKSLGKKWIPLVYRQKNADRLISMNAADSEGRPIVPRSLPGVPSEVKFINFINNILVEGELEDVQKTFDKAEKKALEILTPAVINAFLYKSAEFGVFGPKLSWLYGLLNYKKENHFGPRNIEAIILLRAIEARQCKITSMNWVYRRLRHAFKHNKQAVSDTALITAANLDIYTQLQINRFEAEVSGKQKFLPIEKAILTKKINKFLRLFEAKFKAYKYSEDEEMKQPAANFNRWQHAYSILKLLQMNIEMLPAELQPQFKQTLDFINPFLSHVEKLGSAGKTNGSLLDRLITRSTFPKYEKKDAKEEKKGEKGGEKGDGEETEGEKGEKE